MPKHKLTVIISDLQQGAKAASNLQSEIDFLAEQVIDALPNSAAATQAGKVKELVSALYRDHLGNYDPTTGPTIGHTDVEDDMTKDSVTDGEQLPAGAGDEALVAKLKEAEKTVELFAGGLADISAVITRMTG